MQHWTNTFILEEKNTLLIFIKNPQLGKVKTRIAHTAGDAEALHIYLQLMGITRQTAQEVKAQRHLYYSDFLADQDDWPNSLFEKKVQFQSPDLGERMENAFKAAFEAGATKAVIIGSDCPELTADILAAAFERLDETDFVLGPVPDGGYYLIGMRQFSPEVFHGVEWSTATVMAKTLEIIAQHGKSSAFLPELTDIDHEADWQAYLLRAAHS